MVCYILYDFSKRIYIEKEVGKIMGKFDDFPKRLSLEQQGQFALGYYHQD